MDDLHRRLEQLCNTKQSQGNDVKEDPECRRLLHSVICLPTMWGGVGLIQGAGGEKGTLFTEGDDGCLEKIETKYRIDSIRHQRS